MSDVIEDRMGRVIATAFTRNVGGKLDGELISNALLARSELMSTLLDPRRDVDAECHYPTTRDVSPENYKSLYDRDPIACRVAQCIVRESWQVQPKVFECEDPEVTTPFEEAWDALQPMNSGGSWYKDEESGSVWEYLVRADILSGIGHFGVLLMGFDDGKNLQEPVEGAMVTNAFCPTGEGGGQDNSCGGEGGIDADEDAPRPYTVDEKSLKNRSASEKEFYRALKSQYRLTVPLYHEAPVSALDSIRNNGLTSGESAEDTNFATVGKPSGFVTSPDKLIVKFSVRTKFVHDIVPDMRYDANNPAADLLKTHKGVFGADVAHIGRVLPGDIDYIKVIKNGKTSGVYKYPFKSPTFNWRQQRIKQTITDCYLTKNEEDNLRKLPDLSEQEEHTLNCLAKQREMVVNAMRKQESRQWQPQSDPIFGQTSDEVQGTDKQYSQEFGLRGEADYSPGLSGTDQQYFGVQFGPTELPGKQPSGKKLRLLFLRPFDESLVQIVRYEWNINNPRFGMPVMYRITLNDPREQHSGIGLPMATVFVHWSRVIHLADNLNSSEIFGAPRMRPVLNRLLDLQKIYGASAEGYWQAAFTGISLETHPQLGGDVTIDGADVRDQIENYINSLQRYLALTGMSAHTLAPQVSDPTNQIMVHMEAICIQLGIPVRIFKGSERGELASSQDDASWNDRLKARQHGYITPRVICPFIDRLIAVGVLPEPNYVPPVEDQYDEDGNLVGQEEQYDEDGNLIGQGFEEELYDEDGNLVSEGGQYDDSGSVQEGQEDDEEGGVGQGELGEDEEEAKEEEDRTPAGLTKNHGPGIILNAEGEPVGVKTKTGYSVVWPDLDSNTDKDKAQIAATVTQALAAYVGGNVESVMPLMEFYTKILKLEDAEAKQLVKAAEEQMAQQQMMGGDPIMSSQPDSDQFGNGQQFGQEELPEQEDGGQLPEEFQQ